MPQVTFMPDGKKAVVRPGVTLLDAARKAGVTVRSRCSGGLSCLMCKVKVMEAGAAAKTEAGGLSVPTDKERAKLGPLEQEGYRFACQARVTGDTRIELPEDPLKAAVRAQLLKARQEEELW